MGELTEGKEKKPAITEQQLFETCDSYFKQHNKKPSQQIIRDLIGGSPVTIGPLLRKWKEKRESEEQAKLLMPDHIRDGGMTIIATWWQSIQPTINDMITTAQELADKKVAVAEQEVEEAIATQIWLESENEKLEAQIKNRLSEHQQQIEILKKAQDDRDKQNHELEMMLSDLKVAKAEVEGELKAVKQQVIELKAEKKISQPANLKSKS